MQGRFSLFVCGGVIWNDKKMATKNPKQKCKALTMSKILFEPLKVNQTQVLPA